ncbi:hypothetical protein BH10BDE1_BH10BDE1_21460 [soil metagenome]
MSEFFFVVKTVLFSALVLMLLQMKVGGSSLEHQAESWIYQSRAGAEVQAVARGAIKAGQVGYGWFREQTRDMSATIHDATVDGAGEPSARNNAEPSARETRRERSLRSNSRHDDLD